MATTFCPTSSITLHRNHRPFHIHQSNRNSIFATIRCSVQKDNSTSTNSSESENLFLKTAWYGSELLGIAASLFRPRDNVVEGGEGNIELGVDGVGVIDRSVIVETIKQDFQRSYFVTGALTLDAYEDDCEFADPAGSFKGLGRFKRNCTNFGSLIEKSNMKLMKWEDFEDKGIGHWRFSCTMSFPWKPILSATGYTEYYLSKESGKVCRHVEHWNVPKMALFKQLLKPSRGGFWGEEALKADFVVSH
ncbi:CAAX prenyl protease 1-like protein [Tanacetum coccineum]